jgi:RNA polymerase sigma-70 factor (ECF subfamily)
MQVIRHTAHAHSLKLTSDDEDDLCADTFAVLLERNMATLRGFRGRSSFATYLTIVVRRIVLRKLTQRRYMQALGHVSAHQASVDNVSDEGHNHVDAADQVESLMSGLAPQHKDLLRSMFLNGKSYRDISRELGIAVNSIGPTISRILSALRRRHTA